MSDQSSREDEPRVHSAAARTVRDGTAVTVVTLLASAISEKFGGGGFAVGLLAMTILAGVQAVSKVEAHQELNGAKIEEVPGAGLVREVRAQTEAFLAVLKNLRR